MTRRPGILCVFCAWASSVTNAKAFSIRRAQADDQPAAAMPAPALAALPRVSLRERADGSGDRVFVDSKTGRELVFHGTNVVVKGPPWLPRRDRFDPATSLVDKDFSYMRQVGINLIRLGVMWVAGEAERGQYNDTYFGAVRQIVEDAAAFGIYVLLDMHQDVLSEKFCGQGVPAWAAMVPSSHLFAFPVPVQMRPLKLGDDGFPTRQECNELFSNNSFYKDWAAALGSMAAQTAYESLYVDVDGLTESWAAFWAKVASTVKGLSNVLGFELINEPFSGNAIKNPSLMVPGNADKLRLQGAYDRVASHIRKVNKDALIFFAGVTWDNTFPVGFEHAPGGAEYADRSVLAYHFYVPPQADGSFDEVFQARRADARRLGTGLMMTESCCNSLYDAAAPGLAAAGHSWIHWEWKDWCLEDVSSLKSTSQNAAWGACKTGFGSGPFSAVSGEPDDKVMSLIAQPYAPEVAGQLQGTNWNAAKGEFELNFAFDPKVPGPTAVFVNEDMHFPTGFNVTVNPEVLDVELRLDDHRVLLTPRTGALAGSVLVRIVRST